MSKNKKQQAAYDYLHDNKEVKGKFFWSIMNKWRRFNGDIDEFRWLRKKKKEEILIKEMNNELNYENS